MIELNYYYCYYCYKQCSEVGVARPPEEKKIEEKIISDDDISELSNKDGNETSVENNEGNNMEVSDEIVDEDNNHNEHKKNNDDINIVETLNEVPITTIEKIEDNNDEDDHSSVHREIPVYMSRAKTRLQHLRTVMKLLIL